MLGVGFAGSSAWAADPSVLCDGGGTGTETDLLTGTSWWLDVRENSGYVDEGSTYSKADATDGAGHLYLNYGLISQVEIGAPAANTAVTVNPGSDAEIAFPRPGRAPTPRAIW